MQKTHLLLHKHPIIWLLGAVVGLVCSMGALNSTYEDLPIINEKRLFVRFFSLKYEKALIKILAETLKSDMGETLNPSDPQVETLRGWIKGIGDELTKANSLEDLSYNIIASESVNAFVLGNEVFVNIGIIPIMKDEDGIAMIIGHEIGHSIAGHSADNILSLAGIYCAVSISTLFGAVAHLDFVTPLLRSALEFTLYLPRSRFQEIQADKIGLYMMSRAGYNPNNGVEAFSRLDQIEREHGGKLMPDWFSTHPSTDKRIALLNEMLLEPEIKRHVKALQEKRAQEATFVVC